MRKIKIRPKDHRLPLFQNSQWTNVANILLLLLLVPTLTIIIFLHFTVKMDKAIKILSTHFIHYSHQPGLEWAWHAADTIRFFIDGIPIVKKRACYWRSLMIYNILLFFNFPVTLHCGGTFTPEGLSTHFWVTLDGKILADTMERCSRFHEMGNWPNLNTLSITTTLS